MSDDSKTTTIMDLQVNLLQMFDALRDGSIEPKVAVEINNTAGKVISISKVQIAYHALRGEAPNIPFLAAPVDAPALADKAA